jgi:hypothetical protein
MTLLELSILAGELERPGKSLIFHQKSPVSGDNGTRHPTILQLNLSAAGVIIGNTSRRSPSMPHGNMPRLLEITILRLPRTFLTE